jgi:hypothetical protein
MAKKKAPGRAAKNLSKGKNAQKPKGKGGPAAGKASKGRDTKKSPSGTSNPAASPAVIVRIGDLFWNSAFRWSWFFGAVIEVHEIKADPTEQISVRTVFCDVDGGKWEKHRLGAWMSRSDFHWKYHSEHKIDLDTLNSERFVGLWRQVEPDRLSFVPGRSGVADPEVVRLQRIAQQLKKKNPNYAGMVHDFGDASQHPDEVAEVGSATPAHAEAAAEAAAEPPETISPERYPNTFTCNI